VHGGVKEQSLPCLNMAPKSPVPTAVKKVRDDLSNWVWHFARRKKPLDDLGSILSGQCVKGSKDGVTGTTVVCLTEAPLAQFAKQSPVLDSLGYKRLSDYGVGFRKSWILKQGGLPVIYQPRKFLTPQLPLEYRFRHVDLDTHLDLDYSWQREWRVPTSSLAFTPGDTVVVLPSFDQGDGLLFDIEVDGDVVDGESQTFVSYNPRWSFVAHDQFKSLSELKDNIFEIALKDGRNSKTAWA